MDGHTFPCRLLEQEIDDGACYDIQMIRSGVIKACVLPFPLDREKAAECYPDCPYNPLP